MFFNYKEVQVYYEYQGTGPTIVLLHGWGVDSSTFSGVTKRLQDEFCVCRVDFPGFGKSTIPSTPWVLEDYVDSLRQLLVSEGISHPILLGHSFGGRVAILYAERYPVQKLILVSSAGILHRSLKIKSKIYWYKLRKLYYRLTSSKKLEKLRSSSGSSDYQRASPTMKKTMSNVIKQDLKNNIKKITTPTLLLWGCRDQATPYQDGLWMHRWIKDSTLIPFYTSGHFCYLEEEDKFVTIIKREGSNHD